MDKCEFYEKENKIEYCGLYEQKQSILLNCKICKMEYSDLAPSHIKVNMVIDHDELARKFEGRSKQIDE